MPTHTFTGLRASARWSRCATVFSAVRNTGIAVGWGLLLAGWLQGTPGVPVGALVAVTVALATGIAASACDWRATRALGEEQRQRSEDWLNGDPDSFTEKRSGGES